MSRTFVALFSTLAFVLTLGACGNSSSGSTGSDEADAADAADAAAISMTEDTVILDVRTAAEHAGGYLEGAQLLDFTSGQLAETLPTLDPNAPYLVYCRSGNRSAQATQLMTDSGFSDVTDMGSLSEAAQATGLPILE